MHDVAPGKPQRLFFAVWPGASGRAAIASLACEVARAAGGRATAADKIHLTLAFLGEQPADRIPALHRLGAGIKAPAFVLALDEIGSFRRTGITWLGASAPQSGLAALHQELGLALQTAGFPVDERAYAPHLTLARRSKTSIRRRLPEPVVWPVDAFALVASDLGTGGPTYRTMAEWRLGAG
jgi:2'-5' RNA ligase